MKLNFDKPIDYAVAYVFCLIVFLTLFLVGYTIWGLFAAPESFACGTAE